jgi:hypothetical protein
MARLAALSKRLEAKGFRHVNDARIAGIRSLLSLDKGSR